MPEAIPSTSATLMEAICRQPTDPAAWSRFVFLYGPQIVAWSRHYGLQDADARDVAQDVLLRFSRQIARFRYDPTKSFRGFLRTLTHASWCDWVEGRSGDLGTGDSSVLHVLHQVPAREDLAARMEAEYDRELLQVAMDRVRRRVESRTWEVFRLLAIEGLPGKDAADRVGMQIGSAYAARNKVQRLLRETIESLEQQG